MFRFTVGLPFLFFFSLTACFQKKSDVLLINGAGASFPYILYSKWFAEYRHIQPSVAINYQSIGSGGGIRQFLKGTLDFGATDVPVSAKDLKQTGGKQIVHIPTALGAVAVTYNLNLKTKEPLKLDGRVLAKIFQGDISKWNDKSIQALNKGVHLPEEPVVTVYRADGSGTTAFFTEFLSLSDKSFLKKVGKGKSVQWPVGVGGKGNEGVVGLINKIEGSIGYIAVSYAVVQKLPMAKIRNKAGRFVSPNTQTIMSAAERAMRGKNSYISSLINPLGKHSYPLSGLTYIILSRKMSRKKGPVLVSFLNWALTKGQKFSEPLNFTPLPENIKQAGRKELSKITFQ